MTMQQRLVFGGEIESNWRIDERTKIVGRQGIAMARAILEACEQKEEWSQQAA